MRHKTAHNIPLVILIQKQLTVPTNPVLAKPILCCNVPTSVVIDTANAPTDFSFRAPKFKVD